MEVGEIKRPGLVGRIKGVVEEMDVFILIPGVEQLRMTTKFIHSTKIKYIFCARHCI